MRTGLHSFTAELWYPTLRLRPTLCSTQPIVDSFFAFNCVHHCDHFQPNSSHRSLIMTALKSCALTLAVMAVILGVGKSGLLLVALWCQLWTEKAIALKLSSIDSNWFKQRSNQWYQCNGIIGSLLSIATYVPKMSDRWPNRVSVRSKGSNRLHLIAMKNAVNPRPVMWWQSADN